MFKKTAGEQVREVLEMAPDGIASLDVLESLGISAPSVLKTTLSRLRKQGRVIGLKRGTYSTNPTKDAFACAQAMFNGYLGFTTALYLHHLITETPFTLTVVTTRTSRTKPLGAYDVRAVALKHRAIGFQQLEGHTVSTRAKTLFDCLYLPQYGIEYPKLVEAYAGARLTGAEWKEFHSYVRTLAPQPTAQRMRQAETDITRGE